MQDVCKLFEIKKWNTTAYYPQSEGIIEGLNVEDNVSEASSKVWTLTLGSAT